MAFPPEFLDELRARTDLSGLIGRRVKLAKKGREFLGLCPFHNEKTPSFTVSQEKGFFHCFGCGAHGDAIGFVMQSEGLGFPEAVEKLAGEAGLPVPRRTPESEAAAERGTALRKTLEAATGWFQEQLQAADGAAARVYLEERGLDQQTVVAFRLGHAPAQRGALKRAMNPKGFDDALLSEAGLIKQPEGGGDPRDYFFDRIIFPITDRRGRVVAFGGRALSPEAKAKYINSPETALFHKGRLLYNLAGARQAAHDTGEVLVVEGYTDVIALAQAGFPAAVAPLGTAVTEEQIAELWRLAPEPILCLDGDAAGRRAGYRAAERALPGLRPGCSLRFALLPEGEDPDSLLRSLGPQALREILDAALPLGHLLWLEQTEGRSFDTPERQAGLRQDLRAAVRQIRDADVRTGYQAEMERRLQAAFSFVPARQEGRYGRRPGTRWSERRPLKEGAGPGVRQSPERLRHRQEQVLIATLVNHPELLADHAEDVSALDLANRDLDRLRRALIDLVAREPTLDSEGLRCHLSEQGFTAVLSRLLSRQTYQLGPSAKPETPLDEARETWRHILSRWQARTTEAESRRRGDDPAMGPSLGAHDNDIP
jgi:DNA primase